MNNTNINQETLSYNNHRPDSPVLTAGHQLNGGLFTVIPSDDLKGTLEKASCILNSAVSIIQSEAEDANSNSVYGAAYLVEMAMALIDSSVKNVMRASQ